MKLTHRLAAVLTCLAFTGCGGAPQPEAQAAGATAPSGTPLEVVNQRMDAYNRHDLPSFLALYSEDIEIFTYPDRSLGGSKQHLASIFGPMFEAGEVRVELHHQIEKDRYVVNHETVHDGDSTTEYVSIYEVEEGLIQSVRFVRD